MSDLKAIQTTECKTGFCPNIPNPSNRPILEASCTRMQGDAREVPLPDQCIDLVVTSPPYWLKRDYGVPDQIGQESTPTAYVDNLMDCLKEWRRLLVDWGSVFINIGDTYHNRSLALTPSRLEIAAQADGWVLRNRIVWTKNGGMPDPAKDRLKNRHEFILHFTQNRSGYYYDQFGYATKYGNGTGPADVWNIGLQRGVSRHLAPFPGELVERVLTLACPFLVCNKCFEPRRRLVTRTRELDTARPQAKRALQLAREGGLTVEHIAAIQATGISDTGKALATQNGTGRNSPRVKLLASEAKAVLGGYFREFTFAKRVTTGWTDCDCSSPYRRGIVLDPFMGSGTTLHTAAANERSAVGIDLKIEPDACED